MHLTDKEVGNDRVYWVLTMMYRCEQAQLHNQGSNSIIWFSGHGLAFNHCNYTWCDSYRNSGNSTLRQHYRQHYLYVLEPPRFSGARSGSRVINSARIASAHVLRQT